MTLRTCTVSCEDSDGHEHSLEVTAEPLYEAVAQVRHIEKLAAPNRGGQFAVATGDSVDFLP